MEISCAFLKGAKEIAAAAGVNWRELAYYVSKKGLPAFKIDGRGPWLVRPSSLEQWAEKMEKENLNK